MPVSQPRASRRALSDGAERRSVRRRTPTEAWRAVLEGSRTPGAVERFGNAAPGRFEGPTRRSVRARRATEAGGAFLAAVGQPKRARARPRARQKRLRVADPSAAPARPRPLTTVALHWHRVYGFLSPAAALCTALLCRDAYASARQQSLPCFPLFWAFRERLIVEVDARRAESATALRLWRPMADDLVREFMLQEYRETDPADADGLRLCWTCGCVHLTGAVLSERCALCDPYGHGGVVFREGGDPMFAKTTAARLFRVRTQDLAELPRHRRPTSACSAPVAVCPLEAEVEAEAEAAEAAEAEAKAAVVAVVEGAVTRRRKKAKKATKAPAPVEYLSLADLDREAAMHWRGLAGYVREMDKRRRRRRERQSSSSPLGGLPPAGAAAGQEDAESIAGIARCASCGESGHLRRNCTYRA